MATLVAPTLATVWFTLCPMIQLSPTWPRTIASEAERIAMMRHSCPELTLVFNLQ